MQTANFNRAGGGATSPRLKAGALRRNSGKPRNWDVWIHHEMERG